METHDYEIDPQELLRSLHQRDGVVHDAIKGVVHDEGCRCHLSKHSDWLEARLWQISQEMTEAARRLNESQSEH